ncbi:glycosyl-transferase for dystroglycan-domain-containing protein [Abortiporus biennis]|nr:glycosyl-transferase for dystroglycan-domain-containing protein [Abortiporus biennis]
MSWPSESLAKFSDDSGSKYTSVSEHTIISKLLAQAFHPIKLVPYYRKASSTFDTQDVTITTLVTSNRFKVFKQLVQRYQGPVSVTVQIPVTLNRKDIDQDTMKRQDSQTTKILQELDTLYRSSDSFSKFVDIHLAFSPTSPPSKRSRQSDGFGEGARQFNLWRNVARLFARTDFVMMLDVDFAVCTDWRNFIKSGLQALEQEDPFVDDLTMEKRDMETNMHSNRTIFTQHSLDVFRGLKDGNIALVVPAFEYVNQQEGIDQGSFPDTKEQLLSLASGSVPKITSFHASWIPGHNSTDYSRFYSVPPGTEELYKVENYQSAYEPYVVMNKNAPWCDERFVGYGSNKAACLFEMYISGVSFHVLSEHFLIHQSHKYEEEARKEERRHNRKLYTDYKEEVCLRYLHQFHQKRSLATDQARNALEECRKIKSVFKLIPEVSSALWLQLLTSLLTQTEGFQCQTNLTLRGKKWQDDHSITEICIIQMIQVQVQYN